MYIFYKGYLFEGSMTSTVFYIIAAIFTTIGNLLVILTFVKDPYGQLRKRRNYFLLNLALSDIIMGACVDPLLATAFWTKSSNLLFAHYIFAILSGASSLLNLTALSIIRYYALKDPFGYEALISNVRVTLGLAAIWLQSLHLALLPVLGWTTPSYQLYLYMMGFLIPTIFIFLAYYGVFRAIRNYTLRIVNRTDAKVCSPSVCYIYRDDSDDQSTKRAEPSPNNTARTRRAIEREKSVTKTLVIVMIVFVVSWLPLLVVDVLMVQCESCRAWQHVHLARDISLTLTYFSSGINPILYTLRIRQFRIALLKMMNMTNIDFTSSFRHN